MMEHKLKKLISILIIAAMTAGDAAYGRPVAQADQQTVALRPVARDEKIDSNPARTIEEVIRGTGLRLETRHGEPREPWDVVRSIKRCLERHGSL